MLHSLPTVLAALLPLLHPPGAPDPPACREWSMATLRANPTELDLRCRWRALGPGRFGLSYLELPVYRPETPMPGTHVVGVRGHPGPLPGESYEAWEWRVLRTGFGPGVRAVRRDLELLAPDVAPRIVQLEQLMREAGVPVRRLESWRAPDRQGYLFQQGRSRPGPLATTTLTSLHSVVDSVGRPAARAVDYDVPARKLEVFHAIVKMVGLESYGADSNDRGHVYLPAPLPEQDLILLRTLGYVPEVTLATGAPVDEPLPAGGTAALRRASLEFAREPFIERPAARLAPSPPAGRLVREPRIAWTAGAACGVSEGAGPPAPAAGRDARCAPPRSASSAAAGAARSMDE
jgi:hypothetical protein